MPHRFDLVVHRLRRTEAQIFQRIAFKHVEHFANDDAARAGRRGGDDAVAAIVALNRFEFARFVLVEIGLCDDAFSGLARRDNRCCDWPFVEPILALFADHTQRVR